MTDLQVRLVALYDYKYLLFKKIYLFYVLVPSGIQAYCVHVLWRTEDDH